MSIASRLAIGTAQFGLDYGINNTHGQVSLDDAATILKGARFHGIDTIDTAIAYGNSEERLGEIGIDGWKIVTKLPPIPGDCTNVREWIVSSVEQSLTRLRAPRIHGLLLHQPSQLLSRHGEAIHGTLVKLKMDGQVGRIGVSIYNPDELDSILSRFPVDLIQAPFNILDRRLVSSGWMDRLQEMGIELHLRSVFLQGLLLMTPAERIHRFPRWIALWKKFDDWLTETNCSPLEACLSHALSYMQIHRVIVGIDSPLHFREIIQAAGAKPHPLPDDIFSDDPELLNPALWPR